MNASQTLAELQEGLGHEDHWDEPELPRAMAATELAALQGSWMSVAGSRLAELLIAGRLFTARFEDHVIYMGALELGSDTLPRTVTMRIEEGPARHKGKTVACMYEMDGDCMRFCAAQPGKPVGLAGFPAEDDPKYLTLLLRRQTRQRS